jgi:hypothetical protein
MFSVLDVISEIARRAIAIPGALLNIIRAFIQQFPNFARFAGAFLQGLALTSGISRITHWVVDSPVLRFLLALLIPLPVVAMAVAMAFYGPPEPANPVFDGEPLDKNLAAFLMGTGTYVACLAILWLCRRAFLRLRRD